MTYRMMGGLGADATVVSPETITAFMKALLNLGGCTPAIQQHMSADIPCLTGQYMQLLAPCFDGDVPAGLTATELSQACVQLRKCGLFNKPGCPDMEPSTALPPCMPASEFKPLVTYCGQYPNWDGPDKALNTGCWAISRFPDYYSRVMNMAVCPAPAPPPSAVPAPPPAAPAPAPPVYQTAPPAQATPSESTPSSMT